MNTTSKLKTYYRFFFLMLIFSLAGCDSVSQSVAVPEVSAPVAFAEEEPTKKIETYEPAADETDIAETDESIEPAEIESELDYNLIKPNEIGEIMIIMYHSITEGEAKSVLERSAEDFKSDLSRFYEMGFRLVSLKDLLQNEIKVEAGYTPVVLTFDDGLKSAFSLVRNESGQLIPKPGCAVSIMDEFATEYPDFGNTATFFITGSTETFKGEGTMRERFEYLVSAGHDIGNHTYSHARLKNLTAEGIQQEISIMDAIIKENVPGYAPVCLAYPYGARPGAELRENVLKGGHDGNQYEYLGALAAGPTSAASAPNRNGHDILNMPRVRGTDCEKTDLGWYFDYYLNNPGKRYISDGRPDRISVPAEYAEHVNADSINGKELFIYGGDL